MHLAGFTWIRQLTMISKLTYKYTQDLATLEEDIHDNLPPDTSAQEAVWINVSGADQSDTDVLTDQFNFDKLSISDSLRDRHPPKYEAFNSYEFIILRAIENHGDEIFGFKQLSLFVGEHFLVTRAKVPVGSLDVIWAKYEKNQFDHTRNTQHIVYQLFRRVADDYLKALFFIEDKLEAIEESIEKDTDDENLYQLTDYNTYLRKIVRNLEYLEGVADSLRKSPAAIKSDRIRHEFTDVYEQIERGLSLAKMYQSLCSDLINIHISITSHRVNKVVKTLTIVTVLFLPLSFIAGLYGMNFEYIPELGLKYGYFYIVGLMILIELLLIYLLKRLKWF
jgi:magnesium transporter